MNALDHRPKPPKPYEKLPQYQRDIINDYIKEVATEAALKQEEKDIRVVLDLYIKMICYMLHDSEGFGKKRLTRFLQNHKHMFKGQNRLVTRGEQLDYLNKRMEEIFGKDGFPHHIIDSIIGEVEIIDASQEEGDTDG
jgi:hypothetical protein